ncbi:MAG: hypothetical protein WAL14_01755, partial [Pseudolabrys sp.]
IELTRARGPRLIFNNEEERFSGEKHTNAYPRHSIEHMLTAMAAMGLNAGHIDAWLTSWDYAAVWATLIRVTLEEAPAGFSMLRDQATPAFSQRALDRGARASRHITEQLGLNEPVALIATPHHDNHAWFSFTASPTLTTKVLHWLRCWTASATWEPFRFMSVRLAACGASIAITASSTRLAFSTR